MSATLGIRRAASFVLVGVEHVDDEYRGLKAMDFDSAYRHGFVRVAACTHHLSGGSGGQPRIGACGSRGPATTTTSPVRCTPELRLSGYSIEDIVMHDALLDAVEDAVLDVVVRRRS